MNDQWQQQLGAQGIGLQQGGMGGVSGIGSLQYYDPNAGSYWLCPASSLSGKSKSKESHMVTEVAQDLKKFIRDHKSTIYVIAVLLIVDHFMFDGAMKVKLQSLMQNLVGKVEKKLNETNV